MTVSSEATVLVAVTGSARPYVYDLPLVLSLPAGFSTRFRYRETWVQREANACAAGTPMLLVFHSQSTARLIPLRWATLTSVSHLGPVVHCSFKLGPFCRPDGLQGMGVADIAAALDLEGVDLANRLGPRRYLFPTSGLHGMVPTAKGASGEEAAGDWWSVVRQLSPTREDDEGEADFDGLPFYYLVGFQKADAKPGSYIQPAEIPGQGCGFVLPHGENFKMRVVQWCGLRRRSDLENPLEVDCDIDGVGLVLHGASNLVVGRYDVIEFSFATATPGIGEMSMRTSRLKVVERKKPGPTGAAAAVSEGDSSEPRPEPGDVDGTDARTPEAGELPAWPVLYPLRVPIKVRRNRGKIALGALALLAGAVLFSAESFASTLNFAVPPFLSALAQLAGLALMSVSFGAVRELASGMLGLSRLAESAIPRTRRE